MPYVDSSQVRFYYGGYEPGNAMTKVLVAVGRIPLDTTSAGKPGEDAVTGIKRDRLAFEGLFETSADSMNEAAGTLVGSGTSPATVIIGTSTGTGVAYAGMAHLFDAPQGGSVKGLVRQMAVLQPNSLGFERCHVIAVRGTASGSGASGSVDNGTVTGTGATAYIHIFGVTGTGSGGTITLQDSATGTSWSAVGTIVFSANAATATAIGTTGTFRRYRRVVHTLGTGVTALSYAVVLSGRSN